MVMFQESLFNFEEETITSSTAGNLHVSQITGDLGEIEFDRFCTKNNISYYKASSGAAPIDRIILSVDGLAIRVHIKASARHYNKWNKSWSYRFKTSESIAKADYYYCTGFSEKNHEKVFSLWIPYENTKDKDLNVSESNISKWAEYEKTPPEIMNATNILPFICP